MYTAIYCYYTCIYVYYIPLVYHKLWITAVMVQMPHNDPAIGGSWRLQDLSELQDAHHRGCCCMCICLYIRMWPYQYVPTYVIIYYMYTIPLVYYHVMVYVYVYYSAGIPQNVDPVIDGMIP